jgi:hypothetical protein
MKQQGAQTQIRCASDATLGHGAGSGKYYIDTHAAQPSAFATDATAAAWLWSESEKLTGTKFTV